MLCYVPYILIDLTTLDYPFPSLSLRLSVSPKPILPIFRLLGSEPFSTALHALFVHRCSSSCCRIADTLVVGYPIISLDSHFDIFAHRDVTIASAECNNCVRRNNECVYDAQPRRRGPDKRPGTRQRSCKKRPTDGSEPPPPKKKRRPEQSQSADFTSTSASASAHTIDPPITPGQHAPASTSPTSYSGSPFNLRPATSAPENSLPLPIQQPLLIKTDLEHHPHHQQHQQHQHPYPQHQHYPHPAQHSHQHLPQLRTHTPSLPSPSTYQDSHRASTSQPYQATVDHSRYYQKVCSRSHCL